MDDKLNEGKSWDRCERIKMWKDYKKANMLLIGMNKRNNYIQK